MGKQKIRFVDGCVPAFAPRRTRLQNGVRQLCSDRIRDKKYLALNILGWQQKQLAIKYVAACARICWPTGIFHKQ